MIEFLLEFEFETNLGNIYYLPTFINAKDFESAQDHAKIIESGLKEDYKLCSEFKIKELSDVSRSEFLKKYVQDRMTGKILSLNMEVWKFHELPTIPEINFREHIQIIRQETTSSNAEIARLISLNKLPVRQMLKSENPDLSDCLIIKIVDPENVQDNDLITICIRCENQEYLSVEMINEGIWKESDLKNYFYRVDPPHNNTGERHVHIAHKKHINSKNNQVSWNQNGTRHDKKSFNSKMKGIEKAKIIARKALNIGNEIILESRIFPKNIIVESLDYNLDRYYLTLNKLQAVTMYKNNSRNSSNFKGCSPLQLSCNLTGMCHAIGYYSYTNRCAQLIIRSAHSILVIAGTETHNQKRN